jgi:hypothetical protein
MAFIRVSIDAPSLAYAVSLFGQQQFFICSHGFDTSESLPVCPSSDQCDCSGAFCKKAQNPSHVLVARVPKFTKTSHTSFLYEASYFGLTRQPYLVSLWQLDLERAKSAVVLR